MWEETCTAIFLYKKLKKSISRVCGVSNDPWHGLIGLIVRKRYLL
jgi:hypothetical protein